MYASIVNAVTNAVFSKYYSRACESSRSRKLYYVKIETLSSTCSQQELYNFYVKNVFIGRTSHIPYLGPSKCGTSNAIHKNLIEY